MNADRIAKAYRWLEYLAFGRALERCRVAQLGRVREIGRVLILGEGDGRFLRALLGSFPLADVAVVDSSAEMIELAQGRVNPKDRGRVRFFHRDAVSGPMLAGPFDLVVTNFFLDSLSQTDAASVIARAAAELQPGGAWIVGEFRIPAHGWRRAHGWVWVRTMYLFFRMATGLRVARVPDYAPMLRVAGLTLVIERTSRFGLIVSQLWRHAKIQE